MAERRYSEKEVRKILELATNPVALSRRGGAQDGMSLAELQEIGQEVGIDRAAIARAAAALEEEALGGTRTLLGMPVEVRRVVPLPRALTGEEWEQLVADLRGVFRARGRVTSSGNLREWSNGNLHVCAEHTAAGHRLRMGTLKGDAAPINALAAAGVVTALASLLFGGAAEGSVFVATMLGGSGVGAFVANYVRLPRWANQRERQMEHVAGRVRTIVQQSDRALNDAGQQRGELP